MDTIRLKTEMGTMFDHNACNRMKYAHRVAHQYCFRAVLNYFNVSSSEERMIWGGGREKKETHLLVKNDVRHIVLWDSIVKARGWKWKEIEKRGTIRFLFPVSFILVRKNWFCIGFNFDRLIQVNSLFLFSIYFNNCQ